MFTGAAAADVQSTVLAAEITLAVLGAGAGILLVWLLAVMFRTLTRGRA